MAYSQANNAQAAKILGRAKKYIASGWIRNREASDHFGNSVAFGSPRACKFCMVGAIRRASFDLGASLKAEQLAFQRVEALVPYSDIVKFNDSKESSAFRAYSLLELAQQNVAKV